MISDRLKLLVIKIKISFRTVGWVLLKWRYAVLALVVALLFFELIYWMFNLSVISFILTSGNLSPFEKIRVLLSPFESIATTNGIFVASMTVLLSVIQGISVAVLAYTIRHQQKIDAKLVGGGSVVGLLAVIGLGCPSCGTSLVTPIVALFISGSTVAVSEKITTFSLPLAVVAGLYGMYVLGKRGSTARAYELQEK